jgi:hypothetical protein
MCVNLVCWAVADMMPAAGAKLLQQTAQYREAWTAIAVPSVKAAGDARLQTEKADAIQACLHTSCHTHTHTHTHTRAHAHTYWPLWL